MRRKKKGATLIVVIIIFMFVCSVSMAMLSMVAGNYTARVSESKRVENLYSSESGIDMAYNITGKTIGAGIKYGYYQVSELRRGDGKDPTNKDHYTNLIDDIKWLENEIRRLEKKLETDKKEEAKADFESIDKCKEGIRADQSTINDLFKEEFKRAFKVYIHEESNSDDGQITIDKTNVLKSSISGMNYTDISLTCEGNADSETQVVHAAYVVHNVKFPIVEGTEIAPKLTVEYLKINPEKTTVKIKNRKLDPDKETHHYDVNFDKVTGQYFDLTIQSDFESTEQNTRVIGKNKRRIQSSYKIKVPNYEDWSTSTAEIQKYNIFKDRGLTIGGNMDVSNVETLDVQGDIFVQGKNNGVGEPDNKAYRKYNGGIKINESKTVKFRSVDNKGPVNVNTRGTLNIQNDSKVSIGSDSKVFIGSDSVVGNLYAANVFAGDITNSTNKFTNGSELNVNNVVVDNDLAVTATNTNFTINNFYGINDKNIKYDDMEKPVRHNNPNTYTDGDPAQDQDPESGAVEKSSSSIIINGHQNPHGSGKSTVNILNEAYIMGTAHIATDGDGNYQTGESMAVKGNYTAYAVPVSPNEKFKYDNPLQVLDEDNIFKKAEHFNDYWNGKGKDSNGKDSIEPNGIKITKGDPDDGGIMFPMDPSNIHSIGAIVYKNSENGKTFVRSSNYDMRDEQKDGKVYEKRAEYAKQVYDLGIESFGEDKYIERYKNGQIDKVNDLFDGLNSLEANIDKSTDEGYKVIFNKDDTSTIKIEGALLNNNTMKGVIVTNGNVTIKGPVKFEGTIFAKGDLIVAGDESDVTIKYDKKIFEGVQKDNQALFEAVFKRFGSIEKEDSKADDKTMLKQVLEGQYDIKGCIENKLWKLIQ